MNCRNNQNQLRRWHRLRSKEGVASRFVREPPQRTLGLVPINKWDEQVLRSGHCFP
jgi:hypothetical protein